MSDSDSYPIRETSDSYRLKGENQVYDSLGRIGRSPRQIIDPVTNKQFPERHVRTSSFPCLYSPPSLQSGVPWHFVGPEVIQTGNRGTHRTSSGVSRNSKPGTVEVSGGGRGERTRMYPLHSRSLSPSGLEWTCLSVRTELEWVEQDCSLGVINNS